MSQANAVINDGFYNLGHSNRRTDHGSSNNSVDDGGDILQRILPLIPKVYYYSFI